MKPPDFQEETIEFPLRIYRRRRWPLVVIAFVLLLSALAALAWWQEEHISEILFPGEGVSARTKQYLGSEPLQTWSGGGEGKTLLLIGADRREGIDEEWGRSDTIILARIMPQERAVSLLSLPRDLQVNIPGYGFDKINAAYSYGGPALLIRTIRDFLGTRIDHYTEIDFNGFARMVRETEGVYLPVDQRYYHSNEGLPASEMYSEIDLKPGYQKLGAEDALAFVRYRHTDSDLLRAARQQLFLRELARQIQGEIAEGSLSSRIDLLQAFLDVTRSDIRSLKESLQIGNSIRGIPSERIVRVVMQGEYFNSGGVDYIAPSEEQKEEALRIWNNPNILFEKRGKSRPMPFGDTFLRSTSWLVSHARGKPFPLKLANTKAPLAPITRQLSSWRPLQVATNATFAPVRRELFLARSYAGDQGKKVSSSNNVELYDSPAPSPPASQLRPCTPSLLPEGYSWQEWRSYKLEGEETLALYASSPASSGLLWNWSAWKEAPILLSPDETIRLGGRKFSLWTESGSPRTVAWRSGKGYGWMNNTLDNSLDRKTMLRLARACS